MAITQLASFESRSLITEADGTLIQVGTSAISQTQARTGTSSFRCNPATGVQGSLQAGGNFSGWHHFGLYIATMPSVERTIAGSLASQHIGLRSDGKLSAYDNASALIATGTTVLATGQWYWIGMRFGNVGNELLLQVDGIDQGITGIMGATLTWGCQGTEASGIDIYLDDFMVDSVGFLASSKVALLLPTADSAVGTGWTLGTGTAISGNSGSTAVKNTPPLGVADLAAGSNVKQIRNASANANVSYDATMTTYTAAGVGAGSTVLAISPITATAAPVVTSAKAGTVGVVSNPAITNIALGAGGTAGAFWSGATGGTYATGWKVSFGTLTTAPSVTLGTAPVMRVTQVTSSTRIAVVCFMGMNVAWTPAAAAQVPYLSRMPQLIAQ